jgi:hypothetical protein
MLTRLTDQDQDLLSPQKDSHLSNLAGSGEVTEVKD